jgi:hypothetical protein
VPLVALCALADAPGVLGGAYEMEETFDQLMTAEERTTRKSGAPPRCGRATASGAAGRRS